MRPIVNMPEEDRTMDICNTHKKFGKDRACGSGDILADRQIDRCTDRQLDILITILRNRSRGQSNKSHTCTQPFYGPFSGTTLVNSARRNLLDLYGAREDNRGRNTDHPAGRHSLRTNQRPPPSSPIFMLDALPDATLPVYPC